jgi:hypothetical protein
MSGVSDVCVPSVLSNVVTMSSLLRIFSPGLVSSIGVSLRFRIEVWQSASLGQMITTFYSLALVQQCTVSTLRLKVFTEFI